MKLSFANHSNYSASYEAPSPSLQTVRLNYLSSVRHPSYPNYPMQSQVSRKSVRTSQNAATVKQDKQSGPVVAFILWSALVIVLAGAVAAMIAFVI